MNSVLPFSTPGPASGSDSQPTGPCISEPPRWVFQLPGLAQQVDPDAQWQQAGELQVRLLDEAEHGLLSVRVPEARCLDHDSFSAIAEHAYGVLLDAVPNLKATFPIRMWNVIPGILEPLGGLDHRYMVFNQSRYRAFAKRSGNRFETNLPTATGVGNLEGCDELTIHCLTATASGRPLENPRQVPAYRYSDRFGPKPPCFSRATSVELAMASNNGTKVLPQRRLLIGGTASVRGEESQFSGDLDAQLDETELNLRALASLCTGSRTDWHGEFVHLRVYHRREEDLSRVRRFLEQRFPSRGDVEFYPVNICREELLVEIEGVFEPFD